VGATTNFLFVAAKKDVARDGNSAVIGCLKGKHNS